LAAGLPFRRQQPGRPPAWQTEAVSQRLIDFLNADAQLATLDLAVGDDLLLDIDRHFDRNGEGEAW
jgi:hypothetical protein